MIALGVLLGGVLMCAGGIILLVISLGPSKLVLAEPTWAFEVALVETTVPASAVLSQASQTAQLSTTTLMPASTPTSVATATSNQSPSITASPSPSLTPPRPSPSPTPTSDNARSGHIIFTCFDGTDDEICLINGDGTDRIQLTNNSLGDFYASLTADGTYVLYAHQIRGSNYELFRMTHDGIDVVQLTTNGAQNYAPSTSPDGTLVVFTSNQGDSGFQVWVMSWDTSNARQLTSIGDNIDPSWSPDGHFILFSSSRSGSQQLWYMNADGSDPRQVTDVADVGGRNTWSPDGSTLAFYAGKREDRSRRIYLVSLDGTNLWQVPFEADSLGPAFSPNGEWITFTSVRDGQNEIFAVRSDGSEAVKVTETDQSDYQPRWGP